VCGLDADDPVLLKTKRGQFCCVTKIWNKRSLMDFDKDETPDFLFFTQLTEIFFFSQKSMLFNCQ
jgi:hypothetical protein